MSEIAYIWIANTSEIYSKMKNICINAEHIGHSLIEFQLINENNFTQNTFDYVNNLINKLNEMGSNCDNEKKSEMIYDTVIEIIQYWFPLWDVHNISWEKAYDIDLLFFNILDDNVIYTNASPAIPLINLKTS